MSKLSNALRAQLTDCQQMLLIARVERGELYDALEAAGQSLEASRTLHDEAVKVTAELAAYITTLSKRIDQLEATNRQEDT